MAIGEEIQEPNGSNIDRYFFKTKEGNFFFFQNQGLYPVFNRLQSLYIVVVDYFLMRVEHYK